MSTQLENHGKTKRISITAESAFISGNSWSGWNYVHAPSIKAPYDVLGLGGIASVARARAATFTGAFISIYADPVLSLSADRDDLPSPVPLETTLSSNERLLRATRVGGHWKAEPVESKKINVGDYVISTTAVTPTLRALCLKIDIGDRVINAIMSKVTAMQLLPALRMPVFEMDYFAGCPIICDGFSVSAADSPV